MAAKEDSYVAWIRFVGTRGGAEKVLELCDSDSPGAFKVYREAFAGLLRAPKPFADRCFCPPDVCNAPTIGGRQMPCLRDATQQQQATTELESRLREIEKKHATTGWDRVDTSIYIPELITIIRGKASNTALEDVAREILLICSGEAQVSVDDTDALKVIAAKLRAALPEKK